MPRIPALRASFAVFLLCACGDPSSSGLPDGGFAITCGNGILDRAERCDGTLLDDATCVGMGFGEGTLGCARSCDAFDLAACGAPASCGNGALDGPERCDGNLLAGMSCGALGLGDGDLACLPNCGGFDTSACGRPESCGNGSLDPVEVCDGDRLGGASCASQGFGGGDLGCADDCLSFDTDACACVPVTCEDLSATCGEPMDGCGENLDCGTCTGFLTCGGGGVANQCGAVCGACPSDARCSGGVCVDADVTDLVLDIPTLEVSGRITLNGVVPVNGPQCGGPTDEAGQVTFREITHGYTFAIPFYCDGTYGFGPTAIFPGTYDISVVGASNEIDSNVPTATYVAMTDVVIRADRSDFVLDIPTFDVSGRITLNGALPLNGPQCGGPTDEAGLVTFTETTHGYTFAIPFYCDGTYGFGPTSIFPGTYDISVVGASNEIDSNVPTATYVAMTGVVIRADRSDFVLDIPTFDVSGRITLNGVVPLNGPQCGGPTDEAGLVTFTETTHGYTFAIPFYCDGTYGFGPTSIFPGTYDISVVGASNEIDSNVPTATYVAMTGVVIRADRSDFVLDIPTFDVSGRITLNGVVPLNGPQCGGPTDEAGLVTFTETTHGYTFAIPFYCDGTYGFGPTSIFPGTYDISVVGASNEIDSNVPTATYVAMTGVVIRADRSDFVLDIPTFSVSGRITLNGSVPLNGPQCGGPTDEAGLVTFTETTHGYTFAIPFYCDGTYGFGPTSIFPGTYDISVVGASNEIDSNVPTATYIAMTGLVIRADRAGIVLDIPTVEVSGHITLNGVLPLNGPQCGGPTDEAGQVTFREVTHGYVFAIPFYCDGVYGFGPSSVFPGVYEVSVVGASNEVDSNMPTAPYVVYERLEVR